jgi:hypothetical protein
MTEKTDRELLLEVHNIVTRDHTTLFGQNGDPGLIGQVNDVCKSYSKLNRNFWILVAFLAGSGVLGISIWQFLA